MTQPDVGLLHKIGSLRSRLILMLSIALLPLGLVAVYQTYSVVRETGELTGRDILARTATAAQAQQALMIEAFGAAAALGATAVSLDAGDPRCDAVMQRYIDLNSQYVFAGFIGLDGLVTCSSGEDNVDLSRSPNWISFMDSPRQTVAVNRAGVVSGRPVLVLIVPILDDQTGAMLGAQSVSLPQSLAEVLLSQEIMDVDMAMVDAQGHITATSTGLDDTERFERIGLVPEDMNIPREGTLSSRETEDGGTQPVAIVPLMQGQVYAVGIWAADTNTGATAWDISATAFPILMWMASMGVALLTIDRLVLRHLRELRARMRTFSFSNPGQGVAELDQPPREIAEIATSYNEMIEGILSDRAQLRESVREKDLLLKEIHHRVKNNLQLISSILNMNIRAVEGKDAKDTLKRVQDRVMSLASIHKALYSNNRVDEVRGDRLIEEIVGSMFSMALPTKSSVRTRLDVSPVVLDPDQAVPLCLLATEAVTNALKYVGRPEGKPPLISVSLSEAEDGTCELVVSNSRGAAVPEVSDGAGTGLGSRLIEAFVSQLGGEIEVFDREDEYRLVARFVKLGRTPEDGTVGSQETDDTVGPTAADGAADAA